MGHGRHYAPDGYHELGLERRDLHGLVDEAEIPLVLDRLAWPAAPAQIAERIDSLAVQVVLSELGVGRTVEQVVERVKVPLARLLVDHA